MGVSDGTLLGESTMVGMVDIPYEELKKAVLKIEARGDVCKHPPMARFHVPTDASGEPWWKEAGLICDGRPDKMAGKNTGAAGDHCTNCIRR